MRGGASLANIGEINFLLLPHSPVSSFVGVIKQRNDFVGGLFLILIRAITMTAAGCGAHIGRLVKYGRTQMRSSRKRRERERDNERNNKPG